MSSRLAARDVLVLERHLSARDRPVIAELDHAAALLGEAAHEFRHELGAVVLARAARRASSCRSTPSR